MSRLSELSADPLLREYMQGAAKQAIQPVAEFVAPTVPVAKARGHFKKWRPQEWLKLPDTRRPLKGDATVVGFSMDDSRYNCEPHALDFAADVEEKDEVEDLMNLVQEGADLIAQLSAMSHERAVVRMALSAAPVATDITTADTTDPVDVVDQRIQAVLKGARGMGSGMDVRMLWGLSALRRFKNHAKVRGRFTGAQKGGVNPTNEQISQLFIKSAALETSELLVDETGAEDPADKADFLLDDQVIVFATFPAPSRYDTGFMKTFRKRGAYMTPRFWQRPDGRVEFAGYDWSEEIQICNPAAAVRFNFVD